MSDVPVRDAGVGGVTRRDSISGFDGLRALAALTVLTYHVTLWGRLAVPDAIAPLLWELKGGVAIFFVISGALLYLPYARAIRDGRPLPGWRPYARRRAVRILPAYWIALTVVAIGPFGAHVFGPDAWKYYALSQNYDSHTLLGGVGVAWSLCVEVTFYALLPLFAWVAARAARAQVAMIATVGLASLTLRIVLAGSAAAPVPVHGQALMVALPGLLDWFAIGMGLAVLRAELETGRLAAIGAYRRLYLMLGIVCFLVGVPAQHGDIFLPWYGGLTHLALGVGSGLLVLAVIVPEAGTTRPRAIRVLGGRTLTWVGTISYGIYLWHLQALELIEKIVPAPVAQPSLTPAVTIALVWLAVTAAAVLLGAASWYLLERPSQRLVRARGRGPRRVRASGHTTDVDMCVQRTVDPLNSAGVAVDHLA